MLEFQLESEAMSCVRDKINWEALKWMETEERDILRKQRRHQMVSLHAKPGAIRGSSSDQLYLKDAWETLSLRLRWAILWDKATPLRSNNR